MQKLTFFAASLETLDLSLSLQDYHLQEVTLYTKQGRSLGSALSTQDIMALQRQEERRRQQAKQGVFGFVFKKSKEGSLSTDSLGGRSASPARSDETGRSTSPLQPPTRPQRKRRPAPKPPIQAQADVSNVSRIVLYTIFYTLLFIRMNVIKMDKLMTISRSEKYCGKPSFYTISRL